ncbi:hypothetical protein, conserved [Leishmania donovani]|uniref:RRM domain-containing protein n=1 Tax=Leishmania donovani TaxID=5661 RepID=E9B983_LEIDO|nr:hypothetical protein, conserved [Leishmania donovani]CBZ31806.1 hypothetical protein, conserved [Leishmania donovani]
MSLTMQSSPRYNFFLSGIARHVSSDAVENYFRDYGSGVRLQLKRDKDGLSLGYGWLTFESVDVDRVVASQHELGGSPVMLRYKPGKESPKSQPAAPPPPPPPSQPINAPTQQGRPQEYSQQHKRYREETLRPQVHTASQTAQIQKEIMPPEPQTLPAPQSLRKEERKPETEPSPTPMLQTVPLQQQFSSSPKEPAAQPVFVCIPLSICPGAFLHDPRVFCCTLDPLQVGKLSILATPTPHAALPNHHAEQAACVVPGIPQQQHSTYASVKSKYTSPQTPLSMPPPSSGPASSPPPPPGPPPPHLTAPFRETVPPPPGPPPPHLTAPFRETVPPPPGPPPPPPPPGPPPTKNCSSGTPLRFPPPPGPPPRRY